MEVYLSNQAKTKLKTLLDYLLENWNYKVQRNFIAKFNSKINQISIQPKSCPQSKVIDGFHKCIVSKQTVFYYRIKNKSEIEIVSVFDTRQNPDKLKDEF